MRPSPCVRPVLMCLALVGLACAAEPPKGKPLPEGAIHCLGAAKFQQGGLVHGVAFSPDGALLASAGEDAFVRLWDVKTGRQASESTRHYHGVQFLDYSKDGKLLATVSHGAARILDGTTGKELHLLKLPGQSSAYLGPIFAAAFSPDGKTLATGLDRTDIQLWDVATGKAGQRLRGHTDRVGRAIFTTDGKLLVSASDDGSLRLWDPEKGEVVQVLQGHKGRVLALAGSPDGSLLASAGYDGEIVLWDAATGRETARIRPAEGHLFSLAFAPDGKTLASGSRTGVRLWDVAGRKELRPLEGKSAGAVGSLAFAPDGKTLAAADSTGRIFQWDTATGKDRYPDERPQGRLTTLAFAPNGKQLLSAGEGEAPRLWDIAKGQMVKQFGEPGKYQAVAFSPDGKTLTAATADHRLRRWDLTGKELQKLDRTSQGDAHVALTPDGRFLAWSDLVLLKPRNEWRRFVGIWDLAQERELAQAPSPEYQIYALALAHDGRTVLSSGSMDRTIGLYEAITGQRRDTWHGPEAGISAATFSGDGRIVALGGWDNQVWVRDLATGQQLHRLPQAGTVHGLAISPDRRLIASAGGGHRAVLVRDLGSGKDLHRFVGHRGDVRCLAFSPDGRMLASTGDDGLVLIWDVRAAAQKATVPNLAALPPGDLKTLWADLAGADAGAAHRATWTLAAMPKEGAAFLKEHLRAAVLDPDRVKRLLATLDDDDFFVREKAEDELAALGALLDDILRQALKNPPSLEVRVRLDRLVQRLDGKRLSSEETRAHRAIEALERMASPEAREVLEIVARGATEARITQSALLALERLGAHR